MSNVLGAIYTLRSILFQLLSYGFFVRTCKTILISNHSYCRVHMCAYINQPRATCWDNWLAPIRRWLPCAAPWRSTSKRTYNRWSGRHSMPCLKGGHPHSFVLLLDRKNPSQFLKKTDLQYSPIVIGWLTIGMKNKTFAKMQVLKWSWSLRYSETVIILGRCVLVGA